MEAKGATLEEIVNELAGGRGKLAYDNGNTNISPIAGGQVVGLVNEIKPVKEIVDGIIREASTLMDRLEDISREEFVDLAHDAGMKIILSTIHSAKGLEWKVVYIISMAEGRFPSPAALNDADDIEEERRLFYVAATRARDILFFCHPAFINMSGAGLMPARPCRFLLEIPSAFMRSWHEMRNGKTEQKRRKQTDMKLIPPLEPYPNRIPWKKKSTWFWRMCCPARPSRDGPIRVRTRLIAGCRKLNLGRQGKPCFFSTGSCRKSWSKFQPKPYQSVF
jgi:hypothetical protein